MKLDPDKLVFVRVVLPILAEEPAHWAFTGTCNKCSDNDGYVHAPSEKNWCLGDTLARWRRDGVHAAPSFYGIIKHLGVYVADVAP